MLLPALYKTFSNTVVDTFELGTFQSLLTTGLPGYPPIPKTELWNADRQDTVDLMVEKYNAERAVKITLEILRTMDRSDLTDEKR